MAGRVTRAVWVGGALLGTAVFAAQPARGQGPAPLTLAECIRLALEHHPKVRAAQAMLAQRQNQLAEVERLACTLGLVRPDLKVRRQQAALGVEIAAVALASQEADVRYSVARTYVSLLYARSGRQLARQAVERLTRIRDLLEKARVVQKLVGLSTPIELISAQVLQAEARLVDADKGEAVALASLKQAVGLDPARPLEVVDAPLPDPDVAAPGEAELLRLVQQRNPDLRRAALAEQVSRLEVEAQHKTLLARTVDTFAAGGDIHSAETPPESTEEVYRPAPLAPEMPARLVGSRDGRARSAALFAAKAAEATRGVSHLIDLRAIDTRETLLEKRRKIELTEQWIRSRAGDVGWLLGLAPTERPDDAVLKESIAAITALADLEQYRWQALIELLELERLTLGAFSSGIPEAIRPAAPPAPPR
jgi:hypothetical protein